MTPLYSIVIATRDRPESFAVALNSVLRQRFEDTEIIVVDDGSRPEVMPAYAAILADAQHKLGGRLRSFHLIRRPRGHGSSYVTNYGVEQAQGAYICRLDDDDLWLDPLHLQRAAQLIAHTTGRPVDLLMTNQEAMLQGQPVSGPIWIEALEAQLCAKGRVPDADGGFEVSMAELLGAGGFCHMNCLIVRRALYLAVGGMDETLRWEGDRDFFIRVLDAADLMLHHPAVTSRHNVPDPQQSSSVTTSFTALERRLWQLRVIDKAVVFPQHRLLRAYGRRHKAYALKHVAEELAAQGRWDTATIYAAAGFTASPTLGWLLYTLRCALGRLLRPRSL